MTSFFFFFSLQFFHIKILADFSTKIAKSIEFALEKTHICIFSPIFFQKNHCLKIIHLRSPQREKEGGGRGAFFSLVPYDVPQIVLTVCPIYFVKHFTLTTFICTCKRERLKYYI